MLTEEQKLLLENWKNDMKYFSDLDSDKENYYVDEHVRIPDFFPFIERNLAAQRAKDAEIIKKIYNP